MRDSDKPFVLVRRNRFIFNITPRNTSGWVQMGVWTALLAPAVIVFHRYTDGLQHGSQLTRATVIFLLVTAVWAAGGIWWMKARAEIVDLGDLLREQERAKRGTGRTRDRGKR